MVIKVRIMVTFGEHNDWERSMREASGDIVHVLYHDLGADYMGVFTLKKVKLNMICAIYCTNSYSKKVSLKKFSCDE